MMSWFTKSSPSSSSSPNSGSGSAAASGGGANNSRYVKTSRQQYEEMDEATRQKKRAEIIEAIKVHHSLRYELIKRGSIKPDLDYALDRKIVAAIQMERK